MFGLFKKKRDEQKLPQLLDLNGEALQEGDLVKALRYELGEAKLILEENTYYYESINSGEKVIWLKMIDAYTENQKVLKKS
ncbi:hypothetical protein LVD15_05210 [Fulvivirga maritima]|uniref:hypothetical protein n=1 Tax=Fulvivirga maritima TaxID=2904247 RepID=UPI001F3B1CD1|nr:hypothetical protein [Fulvivirga maritima]UII27823.1 hypothetical protein LVD15_05210 [Fulvivirga maritima]